MLILAPMGRVAPPKRGHQWTQKVGALSQWKRPFEFPTEIGNAIFILVGHNLRLHGCFLDSIQAVLATVWGGFSDFQDDSAIAVEPVQEIARTNGPEMVQKRFCFRQDAWVLATYTTGSTGQRPWVR